MPNQQRASACKVAVIWIDWYAYHVARFRGLEAAPSLRGGVKGIELVGGVGVHAGLKFREALPEELAIETLMPETGWREASKLRLAGMLWRRLTELQPAVVLVPGYYTAPALAAAVWARVHGRTSLLMTESTASDHQRTGWKETLKGLVVRSLFDWAVTGGTAHVAYLQQLGFSRERIVGCYDVVNNAMFREGRATIGDGAREASPYFLYVGRLAEEKNIAGLLRSWIRYRAQGGTWPLVLCGDGPERESLRALAACAGLASQVQFAGLRTSEELVPFYARAGCFVLPSTREPWGLVVNEAMASGLPVLVSHRCGCRADLVVDGVNGFGFDPEDGAGLTRQLHVMERCPPEERTRMGEHSVEIIQHFTPEDFGRAIESIARLHAAHAGAQIVTEVTP